MWLSLFDILTISGVGRKVKDFDENSLLFSLNLD